MPPACTHTGLGSSAFARRYLRNRCFFLFLRLLRCFSSPGPLLYGYLFTIRYIHITVCGFPHSEICGSADICSFPQLIAACHVLLRLLVPRHPPCALCYLTSCLSFAHIAALLFSRSDAHILRYAPLRSPSRALHCEQNPAHH